MGNRTPIASNIARYAATYNYRNTRPHRIRSMYHERTAHSQLRHRSQSFPTSVQTCCLPCLIHCFTIIAVWAARLPIKLQSACQLSSQPNHALHSDSEFIATAAAAKYLIERAVRYRCNAILSTSLQHSIGFWLAVQKAILDLVGR